MEELKKGEIKWWYQVINHGKDEEPDLCVHEVYFNNLTKRITYYTMDPVKLSGYESKEEIIKDLEFILADLKRSDNVILDAEKVDQNFKKE